MKLLLLSSLYPPVSGGAELQAQSLARHCVAQGVPVTVLTQPQPGAPQEETINGVRVIRRLNTLPLGPMWGLSYIGSTWRALHRLVDNETVIHNQQASLHSWPSERISDAYDVPLVLRFACAGQFGDLARLKAVRYGAWMLPALRRADRCIVLSEEMRDEVIASGFPPERVRYRPNGVDMIRFSTSQHIFSGKRVGSLKLLFVGRLDLQKGLDTLLRALAVLPDGLAWQLDIYGAGPLEADLHHLASGLGLTELINFAGRSDDMPSVYREADLLILPSLHEGMPNVILEAMASGLPVLATDIGGSRELLQDWAPDWLIPAGNVTALAKALQCAIAQSHILVELGMRARREIEMHYDFKVLTNEYLEDCEQLLRIRRGKVC